MQICGKPSYFCMSLLEKRKRPSWDGAWELGHVKAWLEGKRKHQILNFRKRFKQCIDDALNADRLHVWQNLCGGVQDPPLAHKLLQHLVHVEYKKIDRPAQPLRRGTRHTMDLSFSLAGRVGRIGLQRSTCHLEGEAAKEEICSGFEVQGKIIDEEVEEQPDRQDDLAARLCLWSRKMLDQEEIDNETVRCLQDSIFRQLQTLEEGACLADCWSLSRKDTEKAS